MLKTFVSTCVLAGLVCGLSAYTLDHRTHFTFSQPVAIPGVTLPAGSYTFRLVDAATGGKVVQVLNESGTRSYGMFLSMGALRPDIAEQPEISFMETGAGTPPAIRTWWVEGSRSGHEFVYSKEQTLRLARGVMPTPPAAARRSSTIVGAQTEAQRSEASIESSEARVEERPDAAPYEGQAAGQPAQPSERQGQPAGASAPVPVQESSPASTVQSAEQGTREELPKTASFVPLAVMLGTLMLAGGMWLRRKAKA
jgi:LPXTG-motif cell wall-anchored protein